MLFGALYGITSGSGATATVRLEKMGEDIVSPGSSAHQQQALLAAFRNVPDFAAVETFYKGKKIPEVSGHDETVACPRLLLYTRFVNICWNGAPTCERFQSAGS